MKDEIKEAIDNLNGVVKGIYRMDEAGLEIEDIKILLDYITNLQEELEEEKRIEQESLKTIQELEEKLYNLTHTIFTGRNYNEVLKSEQDYKSRNEKAIEYIKQSIDNPQPFYEYLFGDENGKVENLDKLLNILQGEDKND